MSEDTKIDNEEKNENTAEETVSEAEECTIDTENAENSEKCETADEIESIREELERMKDKMVRHAAEFDNYKKRTAKEREDLYNTAVCDTVEKILPVKDNLERAIVAADNVDGAEATMADGVKMILKQLEEVLSALGVEEIAAVGEQFDPEKHNAVMHEENDELDENTVCEEFMKGYICKGKVIRHSMVKVAN